MFSITFQKNMKINAKFALKAVMVLWWGKCVSKALFSLDGTFWLIWGMLFSIKFVHIFCQVLAKMSIWWLTLLVFETVFLFFYEILIFLSIGLTVFCEHLISISFSFRPFPFLSSYSLQYCYSLCVPQNSVIFEFFIKNFCFI